MFSISELRDFLEANNSDFEIIKHDAPILSTSDAAKYFDIDKTAPTFILKTETGYVAFISSSKRGRCDLKAMKSALGFSVLKMADRKMVQDVTGYDAGTVPLIGHSLPCIFDDWLLDHDYIYGGTGDELHTLKIAPADVLRLNNVVRHFDTQKG